MRFLDGKFEGQLFRCPACNFTRAQEAKIKEHILANKADAMHSSYADDLLTCRKCLKRHARPQERVSHEATCMRASSTGGNTHTYAYIDERKANTSSDTTSDLPDIVNRIPSIIHIMANILSLPYELHRQILSYLDPVHSMCLGLTCRQLYAIHSSLHKPLPLNAFTYECPIPSTNLSTICFLFTHLETWKAQGLKYCGGCHKFCTTNNSTGCARGRCDKCFAQEVGSHNLDWMHLKNPLQLWLLEDPEDPARLPHYGSSIDPTRVYGNS